MSIKIKHNYILRNRLYLEAPLITEDAVEALKMVSSDETRGLAPLQLLKEMVIRRPTKQLVFLNVLLCHTGHENNAVCCFYNDITMKLLYVMLFFILIDKRGSNTIGLSIIWPT